MCVCVFYHLILRDITVLYSYDILNYCLQKRLQECMSCSHYPTKRKLCRALIQENTHVIITKTLQFKQFSPQNISLNCPNRSPMHNQTIVFFVNNLVRDEVPQTFVGSHLRSKLFDFQIIYQQKKMGGNNEFFEKFERNKYLKRLPSMQRVNCTKVLLHQHPKCNGFNVH